MSEKSSKKVLNKKSSYEGLQTEVQNIKTPAIECWKFMYPGTKTEIQVNIPEFTCICPKTGLPDFAHLNIIYTPNKLCLELKSLKEYMFSFRDVGIFHEHLVNKVLNDCVEVAKPVYMQIQGIFNARGGIQTTAIATFEK